MTNEQLSAYIASQIIILEGIQDNLLAELQSVLPNTEEYFATEYAYKDGSQIFFKGLLLSNGAIDKALKSGAVVKKTNDTPLMLAQLSEYINSLHEQRIQLLGNEELGDNR